MRPLSSARLSFTRDGRWIAVERDAVAVDGRRIAARGAFSAIGFADQIWIASDPQLPRLTRHALDGATVGATVGAMIGAPVQLDAGVDAALIAAPLGAPAAVWPAQLPSVIVDGAVRSLAGLAMPVTGQRFVTANGSRAIGPSGVAIELGGRALGGNVICDGASAVFVVESAGQRELVVVGLANGRVQLRRRVVARDLRVAVPSGRVAMRVAAEHIAVLDLRSGRICGEHFCRGEVTDFAISPDGTRLALRVGDAAPELCRIAAPRWEAQAETRELDDGDDGQPPLQLEKEFQNRAKSTPAWMP